MIWITDEENDEIDEYNDYTEQEKQKAYIRRMKRQKFEYSLYDENTNVLFSPILAEAMFNFVGEVCFDDFCTKNEEKILSIAEYVSEYKLADFAEYCIENGYIKPK